MIKGWAWLSGGGASATFKTIQTPSGTSPVATGPTDILTLAAGSGISIVGDAVTDTITISSSGGAPAGSDTQVQFNDGGAFGADANLVWNKTSDSLGIQISSPLSPLHVNAATGASINSVVTASVTTVAESLTASPTGVITKLAEFPAPSGSSASQNTGGTGFIANGQTLDYEIYAVIYDATNNNYYQSSNFDTATLTDTINDGTTPFSVTIALPAPQTNQTDWLIKRQTNGAGFNDSVLHLVGTNYSDTNFSGVASVSPWPSFYEMTFITPVAPTAATAQEIDIGFGNLLESGITYDFSIRSSSTVGSVPYCEQTGTGNSFTDANGAQQFNLQIDWTPGNGDTQVVRITSNGGSTYSYFFTGGLVGSFVYSGQASDPTAETAWNNDIANAQIQHGFRAYAKTLSPSGVIVYNPTAVTYTATITVPNVRYIFLHDLTGSIPDGAKVTADYVSGVTNGKNVTGDFVDPGYNTWVDGTTLSPTTFGFADATTRYFKLVGFNGTIYSPTPIVVNATTSGAGKYFSGTFSYPSGVTTVKILISVDGVTYTGSRTFNSPTAAFTFDPTDSNWGGNTTISPTASVPTSARIDRDQTSLTDAPHLSIVNTTGSGNRYSSLGFGIAASSASAVTYGANIILEASTNYLRVGAPRLAGYTNKDQTSEAWYLGTDYSFNINASSSAHFKIRSQNNTTLFETRSDRDSVMIGYNSTTPADNAASLDVGRRVGTDHNIFIDSGSTSNSGDLIKLSSGGTFLGGIGAQGNFYIRKTAADSTAPLAIGAVNGLTQLLLDSHSSPGTVNGGIIYNGTNFVGTNNSVNKPFLRMSTATLGTQNRIPFFAAGGTTAGQLTDDADLSFDNGNTLFATRHSAGDGTAALPAYFFSNSSTTGLYRPTGNQIAFSFSGTGRALWSTTGLYLGGTTAPTAKLHLAIGTTSASSAPIKFDLTSAALMTAAEAGAVEAVADKLYWTITTGTARKEMTLNDAALTSGHVATVTTNGRLSSTAVLGRSNGGTNQTESPVLFTNIADANNSGTAETDLYSNTVAAGKLTTNGDILILQYGGTFTGDATSTQRLKAYFGGTAIFDSGALGVGVGTTNWDLYITLIRVSSSVVRCSAALNTSFASFNAYAQYTEVTGLTLSNTQIAKITGTAAGVSGASNQITAKEGYIEYKAVA